MVARHALVVIVLLTQAVPGAQPPATGTARRYPGEDRDFVFRLDSAGAARRGHPFLFFDAGILASLRERARDDGFSAEVDSIRRKAEDALAVPLPVFETEWWDEARTKPFSATYPEIYHHTCAVPLPAMIAGRDLARAYLGTGEERFLRRARAILLHYTGYSFAFDHYDVGLNYAAWGILALDVYDLLFDRFTPAEQKRIDAFFARLLRAELLNDRFWIEGGIGGGLNNHLAWHKKMIAAIAAFYGIDELLEFSLRGPRSLTEMLEAGLMDNGIWCESSLPYHFTASAGFLDLAWIIRSSGHGPDPFHLELSGGRSLRDLALGIVTMMFPDRSLPPLGDAYGRRTFLPDLGHWGRVHHVWKDPVSGWLLSEARERDPFDVLCFGKAPAGVRPPPAQSRLYPEHGYVLIRSREGEDYWEGEGFSVLLTYDRAFVHTHQDKLSMMLYGYGRWLAADREAVPSAEHSFSSAVQNELNRHTLAHNTVMVDDRAQSSPPEKLDLVAFHTTRSVKAATIADRRSALYPGVRQMRSVVVTDACVVDVFQVAADAPHTFTWILHPEGEEERLSVELEMPDAGKPPRRGPPWNWLRDGRAGSFSGRFSGRWRCGDRVFSLDMAPIEKATAEVWSFPADDRWRSPGKPVLLISTAGKRATFAALYRVGKDPGAAQISARETLDRDIIRVDIMGDRIRSHHLIPAVR